MIVTVADPPVSFPIMVNVVDTVCNGCAFATIWNDFPTKLIDFTLVSIGEGTEGLNLESTAPPGATFR